MRAFISLGCALLAAGCSISSNEPPAEPSPREWRSELGDQDPNVRFYARLALAQTGTAALPELIECLRSTDSTMRFEAASALCIMNSVSRKDAVPALTDALRDENPATRRAVLEALRSVGSDATLAAPGVQAALGDEDADVRRAAAYALPAIQGADAVHALTDALEDPRTCWFAADALGELGPDARPAVPELLLLKSSGNPVTRETATRALARILEPVPCREGVRAVSE
jgi:HEAT repeat protein